MSDNSKLTNTEIANRIDTYLKRFEGDEIINAERPGQRKPFEYALCVATGRWIYVDYGRFAHFNLTRQQALDYLARLDSGHVGRHYAEPPTIEPMV